MIETVLAVLVLGSTSVAQELPTRPDVVTGELDNGLRYVVMAHAHPPEQAALWLHISTGSLNETDEQRGLAHFLEHLAFNGSEHFPPGEVIDFFQSLGLTFGRHQNAMTSFDQTNYLLQLQDNDGPTLDKGMLFLSDVAAGLLLLQEEIDAERQIILEENRTSMGALRRTGEYVLANQLPGSRVGERLPIGVEETIRTMGRDDFLAYYRKWYVPSNMTLLVVADMDPAAVVSSIERHFSGGERVPRPEDADPEIQFYTGRRAIVVTDPELASASVGLSMLAPPVGPTVTEADARRDLVDALATATFNRRLSAHIADGEVSFRRGGLSAGDMFRAVRLIEARATGGADRWRRMLADLIDEVQRARVYGFAPQEIGAARQELIAGAELAAEREPTSDAMRLIRRWNESVVAGEPIMSAAQRLDLVRRLAPGITDEEVSAAFAALVDLSAVTFLAQLPESAGAPTEEELVKLGSLLLEVEPEAPETTAAATSLMEETPEPGKIVEVTQHPETGVWSAWLENNVLVHHRFMDYREGEVRVTISLAGGQIQETADNRGVTEAAAPAWSRPATPSLSSTQIRDLLAGTKISVGGGSGADVMTIQISGSAGDIEPGFQLAHLLLTEPRLERPAFTNWLERQRQGIEARPKQPIGALLELWHDALLPDVRQKLLTGEQLDNLSPELAQAWLERMIVTGPIEAAIVGDIPRERALELAATYLGSLPERPRISEGTLDDLRSIERPTGPIEARRSISTITENAAVMAGFYGPDGENVRDSRLMMMAGRILRTRMIDALREDETLLYSPMLQTFPAVEYPGFGLVFLWSTTAPDKAETLGRRAHELFAEFAEKGPTDEELTVVKGQLANDMANQRREPAYWMNAIAQMAYRGTDLDDVQEEPGAIAAYTAEDIRSAFARYCRPEARFLLIVTPEDDDAQGK